MQAVADARINVLRHSHGSHYSCVLTVACGENARVVHRAKVSEQSIGLFAENLICFYLYNCLYNTEIED